MPAIFRLVAGRNPADRKNVGVRSAGRAGASAMMSFATAPAGRAGASAMMSFATAPAGRAGASAMMSLATAPQSRAATIADEVFRRDTRPVILFDGECNLCNGGVNFMLDWDKPNDVSGEFRFAALQSEVGRALLQRAGRAPDDLSSIVLVSADGSAHIKSEAILRIGSRIGGGTPLAPFFAAASGLGLMAVPTPLRNALYDVVATSRYDWFGSSDTCRTSDERYSERFVSDVSVAAN